MKVVSNLMTSSSNQRLISLAICLPYYLLFMLFPRALAQSETWTASSWIWKSQHSHYFMSKICERNDRTKDCSTAVTLPLQPPHVTSTLLTISLHGRWSTSGSNRGNAHFLPLQEYNRGSGRKKNKRTNVWG